MALARLAIQQAARRPWPRVLEGWDREIALGVLNYHPTRDTVLAAGVDLVSVLPTMPPHGWIFAVTHPDGEVSEYSYQYAVRPNREADKVIAALRYEVKAQIDAFRRAELQHGEALCGICGKPIFHPVDSHVDHTGGRPVEFAGLVKTFLAVHGPVVLMDDPENKYLKILADRDLAAVWQRWHFAKARLRLLHPACHLNKGNLEL